MKTETQSVEITLTRHNAALASLIAAVKNTSVEKLVCLCLKGSTNPTH